MPAGNPMAYYKPPKKKKKKKNQKYSDSHRAM